MTNTGQISAFDLIENKIRARILELLPTPNLSYKNVKFEGSKINLPFALEMDVDSMKLIDFVWKENQKNLEQYFKIANYANHVFNIDGIVKVFDKQDRFLMDIRTPQQFVERFPKLYEGSQIIGIMEKSETNWELIDFKKYGL